MDLFGPKLREYFLHKYKDKDFVSFFLAPQPYSFPVFEISWSIYKYVEVDFLLKEISNVFNIKKYPGKIISSIDCAYLSTHPRFGSLITILIQPTLLNKSLFESFVDDFDELVLRYERICEIKKPFST